MGLKRGLLCRVVKYATDHAIKLLILNKGCPKPRVIRIPDWEHSPVRDGAKPGPTVDQLLAILYDRGWDFTVRATEQFTELQYRRTDTVGTTLDAEIDDLVEELGKMFDGAVEE